MSSLPVVNIASRQFKADPYPFYARLRAQAPVHPTILPDKQTAWLITRYEQIRKLPWIPKMFRPLERNLLGVDWDDHKRLRGLIHQAFTPRMIERIQDRVEKTATPMPART